MKNRKWIIISLTLLFVLLSVLITTNLIKPFDTFMYELITYGMNDITTIIYKAITFLGSTLFIVLLCIVFLILFIVLKKKNVGLVISSVLIISTLFNNLLKIIFCRTRPDVIKLVHESSYSFPSGHTMASVSMYGILIYILIKSNINKKIKLILITILGILPILVGLSRVYLGAHYISDIIGGFIVSIILLLIETYIIDKKKWL